MNWCSLIDLEHPSKNSLNPSLDSFELNVRLAWAGSRAGASRVHGNAFGGICGANELSREFDLWSAAKSRNS